MDELSYSDLREVTIEMYNEFIEGEGFSPEQAIAATLEESVLEMRSSKKAYISVIVTLATLSLKHNFIPDYLLERLNIDNEKREDLNVNIQNIQNPDVNHMVNENGRWVVAFTRRENMDTKLEIIIKNYTNEVDKACQSLLDEINRLEVLNLRSKWDFYDYRSETYKTEFDVADMKYILHGIGCTVLKKDKPFLFWEFGYRSRWCGIDPWKVAMTLQENEVDAVDYYDGKLIKEACDEAVTKGEMFEKNGLYYFAILKSETFKPDFPNEFDDLLIIHHDKQRKVKRNKTIDRFLRKSTSVYDQIEQDKNKYTLKFIHQDKEVYSIAYNDIGFPENAIKIMSDDIIRNL